MPERQRNGLVIAVTNRAASINARVAAHHLPAPSGSVWIHTQHLAVLVWSNTVRMFRANVNRLATRAVELLHEVRFARTATECFVAESEFVIHYKAGLRHEEPFALAAKCPVLARVALAR